MQNYSWQRTYFVPSNCELAPYEIRALSKKKNVTIGGHTKTHPEDLKGLNYGRQFYEILSNKIFLEEIIGRKITLFAPPSGKYNATTIEALENCGFDYLRKVAWGNIERLPIKVGKSVIVDVPSIFIHPDKRKFGGVDFIEYAKTLLELKPERLHVWGHSDAVVQCGFVNKFVELLELLKNYENSHSNL
ncbi:MAG TPA: polysaccharide deacetylase family protein [Gammaproteobacteria bacterium]|nr:polysaccharide deacetylase family protein [Gammaproteobacteria bacterium]